MSQPLNTIKIVGDPLGKQAELNKRLAKGGAVVPPITGDDDPQAKGAIVQTKGHQQIATGRSGSQQVLPGGGKITIHGDSYNPHAQQGCTVTIHGQSQTVSDPSRAPKPGRPGELDDLRAEIAALEAENKGLRDALANAMRENEALHTAASDGGTERETETAHAETMIAEALED